MAFPRTLRRRPEAGGARFHLLLLTLCGCAPAGLSEAETTAIRPVVISSTFETPRDTVDNIDSPAVWHGPDGQHWLLATAKETDLIVISDAATGAIIRRFGGEGTAPGQLDRPNGVAVIDDLLFIVERDNARVQVLSLPELRSFGTFGESELQLPYGISVHEQSDGSYSTYITDNYEQADEQIPPDHLLGQRVRHYIVDVEAGKLDAKLRATFGATSGGGVLRVVESILADPDQNRLMIAEEQEGASLLKLYSLDGYFTGRVIDDGLFATQAEGIVLYRCGPGEGYWIATDQSYEVNNFHVFDRATLRHIGTFQAQGVLNTDGIALTQEGFGRFPAGAFYAVHNDGNVAAISWLDVAGALGLRSDCRG